jgi:hydroxyacylglutathione hydrolase
MRRIAAGVWQLTGFPANFINAYLMEDVLVDTGTRWARHRFLRQLRGRTIRLVALTHCHPDHQGNARAMCEEFGVPLACHEADVAAVEGRGPMGPENWIIRLGVRFWAGPPQPVNRILRDGDELAGFRVIHGPGHTPGQIIFFRDSDRIAIAGDVLANLNFVTGMPELREPPHFFSVDPLQNRSSIRKLAGLGPSIVCFGHGPPLRNPHLLERFVSRLA